MELDPYGQPYSAAGASQREVRDLCEMMGMVKDVLADGLVTEEEA